MHTKGTLYRAHSLQPIELEMKALQLALRIIVAGLLLLALAFASYRAGFNARCKTGNMIESPNKGRIGQDHDGFGWMSHALACTSGGYQLIVPSEAGHGDSGYLLRKGRPFLLVTNQETDLFDDTGEHILFSITRGDLKGRITYSAQDEANGVFIENVDIGADGTLDLRTTEMNGRRVKMEYRIGEQWLETVQKDGRTGVIFDGRFMPVADAIKLDEKSKARR
jgi:hypothetical protein